MLKKRIDLTNKEIMQLCANNDCDENVCPLLYEEDWLCLRDTDSKSFPRDFLNEEIDVPDNKQEPEEQVDPKLAKWEAIRDRIHSVFMLAAIVAGCVFIAKIIMLVLGE